jgi:transcriptional regulator with XRE-family HTH domain
MGITESSSSHCDDPLLEYQWAGRTASRMLVGAHLRRLREAANITRDEAAHAIQGSASKISRLELGRTGFKLRDLTELLSFYGVADADECQTLLALAKQANRPGWWRADSDALPSWLHPYLGLEQAAVVIRMYEVQFIPGLLQTRGYAHAVIETAPDHPTPDLVGRRVDVRIRRQELLRRPRPPRLWVVIEESALRRPVGGAATMRIQLRHLIEMCELPNVSIQILPSRASQVPPGVPVTILRFPEGELPDVVYMEHLFGATYLEKVVETEPCVHVVNRLGTAARPPTATPELLRQILTDM